MRTTTLLLLALLPLCGHAAGDEPTAAALMAEASRLFTEEADLEGALRQFEASYAADPSWRALNGIALVYQQQGRYVDALETYERLMTTFVAQLSDKQRVTVNERVRSLEGRVGTVQLRIAPSGTTVLVDGREQTCDGGSCKTRVLPGGHTIVASQAGHYTRTQKIEVAAGASAAVDIALQPETERVRIVSTAPTTRQVRRFPRWSPWVTLGGGAVLMGIGGALSGAAASDYSNFDAQVRQAAGMPPQPVTIDPSLADRGRILSDVSYALFAIGGAAIITGSVLALLNRPQLVIEPARAESMGIP